MLPKTFLSVSGTRKRTSGAAKGVRTPSSAHQFRTPNPVEKKKKANKAETTLKYSIEELTGQLSKNMSTIEEHSSQYNITDEILQSLANMSNPKVNHQDQEQIRNQEIVTSVVKSIVPIIVQVIQKTVESAVKESLKAVPKADKRCLKMLSEQVNPRALIAKYECDDLNQQGRKESLRLYGVQVKKKETNEELMQTVLMKIAEADVPISEADISVCH